MAYIQGESRSQTSLFPVSLEELIPEGHLVRVIDLYVAKLDLGQLGFEKAQSKATGRPAYDPADQLKLYLYGYFQRIRSSRRLEAECQRNIEVKFNNEFGVRNWVNETPAVTEMPLTQSDSSRTISCAGFLPIGVGSVLRRHVGKFGVGAYTSALQRLPPWSRLF